MDLLLKNKIALVTGASRGLGAATAVALAQEGAGLALSARDQHALNQKVDQITANHGTKAIAISADLSESGAAGRCCRPVCERVWSRRRPGEFRWCVSGRRILGNTGYGLAGKPRAKTHGDRTHDASGHSCDDGPRWRPDC